MKRQLDYSIIAVAKYDFVLYLLPEIIGGNMPSSLFDPMHLGCRPVADIIDIQTSKGLRFLASHNTANGTGTAATVLITVPATGTYHLRGTVQADAAATWTFSKAPNASAGTTITAYNTNDGSSVATTLTHTHTATYVSSGTVMTRGNLSSSVPLSGIGGFFPRGSEWILAASQVYLILVQPTSTTTNVIINLDYYRET